MCKAGFAGDDAPRAVFRKSTPAIYRIVFAVTAILARIAWHLSTFVLTHVQLPSSDVLAIMGRLFQHL